MLHTQFQASEPSGCEKDDVSLFYYVSKQRPLGGANMNLEIFKFEGPLNN